MVNLRQIMSRDFPISPLVRREGRNRLALQSCFLPNNQAVKDRTLVDEFSTIIKDLVEYDFSIAEEQLKERLNIA